MDTSPIRATGGLAFGSPHDGLMHPCRQNIHTEITAIPKHMAPRLTGSVKLLCQPAEERLGGWQAAIDDGLMGDPGIDMALVACNWFGTVSSASRSRLVFTHGGHPLAAATPLMQPQIVISRQGLPIQPVVVTVDAIQGGTTYDIIPASSPIKCAVRTLHTQTWDIAEAAIKCLAGRLLLDVRIRRKVDNRRGVPCLANDDRILESYPMR